MNVSKAFSDYSFPLRKTAATPNPAQSSVNTPVKKTTSDRFEFSGMAGRLTEADLGDQNRKAAESVKRYESADALASLLR